MFTISVKRQKVEQRKRPSDVGFVTVYLWQYTEKPGKKYKSMR